MAHAPRSQCARGNHCERKSEAECGHDRKAERHFFELQADEQNRERRRTRHQTAGNAKQNDLRRGDGLPRKPLGDVLRVGALMGVFKFSAGRSIFMVVMVVMVLVLTELHAASVMVMTVAERHRRIKLMRLRDVHGGF